MIKKNTTKRIFYILSGSIKIVSFDKDGNISAHIHKTSSLFNEVDNFITITQNRVVYANEDDTNIFGFLLNDALSTNIDYGQIYLSLYKTIIKNIATKCKIN